MNEKCDVEYMGRQGFHTVDDNIIYMLQLGVKASQLESTERL